MADTTLNYGWPFQELADPPNGATLGADGFQAADTTVKSIETTLDARIDALEALGIAIVRKSADTSRVNNTYATDPHLTLNVAANTRYRVRAVLFFIVAGSNSTVDIKAGFTIPATNASITYSINGPDLNIVGGSQVAGQTWQGYLAQTTANSSAVVGVSNSPIVPTPVILEGILNVGATAGSVTVGWAQNTTSANQLTLKLDSYLEYMKVA